jgi:protein O-mannosyl-transferase
MKKQFLLIAAIILVLGAVYLPNIGDSFTNWDFQAYKRVLYSNEPLETSWRLLTDVRGELVSGYYAPLASISLMTDKFLVGASVPRARVTILINLIFHSLNGVLLFFLVRAVGGNLTVCALTMFIFLLHPVQVSPLLWSIQRKTVLSGAFYLASFLAYVSFRNSGDRVNYVICLFLFILALLSKPSAVTLPLALLLTEMLIVPRLANLKSVSTLSSESCTRAIRSDFCVRPQFCWRVAVQLLPFFLIALTHGLLTMQNEALEDPNVPLQDRPLIAAAAFWFYVGKILVPFDLVAVYPLWNPEVSSPLWWIPFAGMLLFAISLAYWRKRISNDVLWGLGNFVVGILPVIGILKFGYFQHSFVADHFLYMALPGIAYCIAIGFDRWVTRLAAPFRQALAGLLALYLAFLTIQTYLQTKVWENSVTLWSHTLKHNSASWSAHHGLGLELLERGQLLPAETHLRRAAEIRPENIEVLNAVGNLLAKKGNLSDAEVMYRKSLKLKPDAANTHSNLGMVLGDLGKMDEAMQHLQEAARLDPGHGSAYNNMGLVLKKSGNIPEAVRAFENALGKEPYRVEVHINLGNLLEASGKVDQAAAHYEDALKFKPESPEAHFGLGNVFARSQRIGEAIGHYRKCLELDPDFASGHNNLGVAYLMAGHISQAIWHFRKALEIEPDYERAKVNLQKAIGLSEG